MIRFAASASPAFSLAVAVAGGYWLLDRTVF